MAKRAPCRGCIKRRERGRQGNGTSRAGQGKLPGLSGRRQAGAARLPTACIPRDAGQCEAVEPRRHARGQGLGGVGSAVGQGHGGIVKGGGGGAGELTNVSAMGPEPKFPESHTGHSFQPET